MSIVARRAPKEDRLATTDAQEAFEDHLAICDTCKAAASGRSACDEGKRLHEAMVVAAHEAHQDG